MVRNPERRCAYVTLSPLGNSADRGARGHATGCLLGRRGSRIAPARGVAPARKPPGRAKKPEAAPVVGDGAGAAQAPGRSSAPCWRRSDRVRDRGRSGSDPGPRLLSLEATAAYLSVSPWTVRSWWAAGMLHAVEPVLASGKSFRRLMFDGRAGPAHRHVEGGLMAGHVSSARVRRGFWASTMASAGSGSANARSRLPRNTGPSTGSGAWKPADSVVAWVQVRQATAALEGAPARPPQGLGRRPGARDLERFSVDSAWPISAIPKASRSSPTDGRAAAPTPDGRGLLAELRKGPA